jgi:hypothetical protein
VHPEKVICQKRLQVTGIEEDTFALLHTFLPVTFFSKLFTFSSTVSKSAKNSAFHIKKILRRKIF